MAGARKPFNIARCLIENVFRLLHTALVCVTAYLSIIVIMDGLVRLGASDAATLTGLAKVVEALHLNHLMPWSAAGVCGMGWLYERREKKRAIREKGRLQRELEKNDPNRTSSGLTDTGDTPEDDDD